MHDDTDPNHAPRDLKAVRRSLQQRLCELQEWLVLSGERAAIVLEGRTGAGRSRLVRELTRCVSPQVFRVVALPLRGESAPPDQLFQHSGAFLPARGEVTIFSPSWYRGAIDGIVLGRCSFEQRRQFLQTCPIAERLLVETGTRLIKLWLELGPEEQQLRIVRCLDDPLKHWRVGVAELELYRRRYDVSKARDLVLEYTDTSHAPWTIVPMDNKARGAVNAINHIVEQFPVESVDRARGRLPERDEHHTYDEYAAIASHRLVREVE